MISSPVSAAFCIALQDLRVVGVEDARVGHEQLEAGDALVDQLVHRLERVVVDAADDLVEAVVDRAVAGGLGVPGGQAVLDPLAVPLHGEVDDRRRAAPGRRPGAGLEGVGGVGAAERQLHVGVRVDAAGDDVLAGRVDHGVDVAARSTPSSVEPGRARAAIVSPSTSTSAAAAGGADDGAAGDQGRVMSSSVMSAGRHGRVVVSTARTDDHGSVIAAYESGRRSR